MPSITFDRDSLINITQQEPIKDEEAAVSPAPPKEKERTHEELVADAKDISERLFGIPTPKPEKPKPEEKPTPDEKPADEKKKQPEEKPAEETPPAEPKPAPKPRAKPPTSDEIAERVAERLKPAAQEKSADVKAPELSEDDQRERNIFGAMEKSKPDDYNGLVTKFDRFVKLEKDYRAAWEKANPGKAFDPEDEAHAEFYDTNEPTYKETDYHRAAIRVEADAIVNERMASDKEERTRAEALKQTTEKLKGLEQELTTEVLTGIDPELAKLGMDKLKTADPLANLTLRGYMPALNSMCAELTKWFTPGLNARADQNNPVHGELLRAIYSYENEIMQMPEEKRANGGRAFAPIEDFNKMTPAQRSQHWTIWMEPTSIRSLLVRDFTAQVKSDLASVGWKSKKAATVPADKPAPKPDEKKPEPDESAKAKSEFPNTAGGADGVAPEGAGAISDSNFAKTISKVLFEN